ncbi:Pentatricopeptide repeat-containing protein [Abeliophyllum distichum]|uniref:Pentatricopeptide repeat-containing protein n=1 Tax=Abeliophyllum distichum TaxID=126358 RepID=A0ABD1VVX2_9LAMI
MHPNSLSAFYRIPSNVNICRSVFLSKRSCFSVPLIHQEQQQKQVQKGRQEVQQLKEKQEPSIVSPARIRKLIAAQSDPLLAKEIFDLTSRQPNFRHSYATFHTLILKLGRSRHFSLMQSILASLKSHQHSVSPSLFSHIIQIYDDAALPEEALKTFYKILEFNMKPLVKHLNCILEILVVHRNFLRSAFDLFKSAHKYGVYPNTKSYNILMQAFCLNGDLSISYSLFNQMFKREVVPDVESYRILMQGLCRKSQVNRAVDLLEDMLNKGFVPDTLSYTTLLNSLCRKKKLKEAYKLLCRMKVKGCNPDIVHYNTVILGFCREGRAIDACKVLDDMPSNGCFPNLVSYRTVVGGLCNQGMYHEAKSYINVMMSKGFSSTFFCCSSTYQRICAVDDTQITRDILEEVLKVEIKPYTRIGRDSAKEHQVYQINSEEVSARGGTLIMMRAGKLWSQMESTFKVMDTAVIEL